MAVKGPPAGGLAKGLGIPALRCGNLALRRHFLEITSLLRPIEQRFTVLLS
jgi:hypothetical protein